MSKITSREAYYERLKGLADVNKTSLKERKNSSLGTLIDYKRSAEGIAYGIIKENHKYYIKKAGINSDPDVSDFAYIGGLANITNYQYKSLSEADKNRNMLLHTINEATSLDFRKNKINEDKAEDEISSSEAQLDDLEAATAAEKTPDEEMAAGLEAEPAGAEDIDVSAEEIPADGDSDDMGGEPEAEGPDADDLEDEGDESEIEKLIGKVTNKIRKEELEPSQVKSYVNSFLSAFKDKFGEVEIEDRKEMANKILKVVPPEDLESLGADVEKYDEIAEGECNECSQFAQYAESMGYDSAQSLMECGAEEVTNLVSGFANAKEDGENDGDHENVALVIKAIDPEILNGLKNDYGHEEYAEELTPYVDQMNEATEEESIKKLDELFGGIRRAARGISNFATGMKGAKDTARNKVTNKVQQAKNYVHNKTQQAKDYVNKQADDIKKGYHSTIADSEQKRAEEMANSLAQQIKTMNDRREKAGKEALNIGSVLSTFSNQLKAGGSANLAGSKLAGSLEEDNDPAAVEVQPEPETEIAPAADNMGVVAPSENTTVTIENGRVEVGLNESEKPSAGLSKEKKSEIVKKAKKGEDIGKKGNGLKEVEKKAKEGGAEDPEAVAAAAMWKNVKREGVESKEPMSEGEMKLRKYIRARLEEKVGLKKSTLNEDAKSPKLKKLDEMIDKQFEGYGKEMSEISTGLAQRAARQSFDRDSGGTDILGDIKNANQTDKFTTYLGDDVKNYIDSFGLNYQYDPHTHTVILAKDNDSFYLKISKDGYEFSKQTKVAQIPANEQSKLRTIIKKFKEILKGGSKELEEDNDKKSLADSIVNEYFGQEFLTGFKKGEKNSAMDKLIADIQEKSKEMRKYTGKVIFQGGSPEKQIKILTKQAEDNGYRGSVIYKKSPKDGKIRLLYVKRNTPFQSSVSGLRK